MHRITPEITGFREQHTNLVIIILMLVVMAVPVLLLRSKLDDIAAREADWQPVESAMALQEELKYFKEDLDVDIHLKQAIQRIIDDENLRETLENLSLESDSALAKAKLKIMSDRLIGRLTSLGYPQPLFLVLAGPDLRQIAYFFSEQYLGAGESPETAAEFICAAILQAKAGSENLSAKKKLKEVLKKIVGDKQDDKTYYHLEKKYLTSYSGGILKLGMVTRFFSDLYNFQSIMFYSDIYQERKLAIKGLIAVGYLEEHIKMKLMLKKALVNSRNAGIRRFIAKPGEFSGNRLSDNRRLFASVVWYGSGRERSKSHTDRSDEIMIGVEWRAQPRTRIAAYQQMLKFASGLLVLFGFAMLVNVGLRRQKLPFSLRRKIIMILALALFIPGFLVAILAYGIAGHIGASRADLAQSQLTVSLDLLEMYYNEMSNRQTLSDLHFKLAMTELLQKTNPEQLSLNACSGYLLRHFNRGTIYDLKGRYLSYLQGEKIDMPEKILFSNLARFLNNTAGLQANSTTRKHLDKLAYTDGFVDGLMQQDFFRNEASCESEEVASIENINPLSRAHFFLFPDISLPELKPKAIGFFRLDTEKRFHDYVTSRKDYPHRFFSRPGKGYQTDLAIAHTRQEGIIKEFALDLSSRPPLFLQPLMHRAKESGSSGNATGEESDTLTAWRFNENWSLIFVGAVKLHSDDLAAFYLSTFPYALLVFTLLVLLVFSEVLSNFFLSPLDAVMQGMQAIAQKGELQFRVEIKNNDEFDKVGDAFNDMVAGLLQKRHISRFVSSSLIKNIDHTGQNLDDATRFMTVLASDLRGFTSLSEKYPAEDVVALLNDYFTVMEAEIQSEGGIIYRFIGDAIVAVFSEEGDSNTALRACRAAGRMRTKLAEFNMNQQSLGRLCVDNGIGIASGPIESAEIGQESSRRDFMFFGEPVVLAEKLEAASKAGLSTMIILDKTTAGLVEHEYILRTMQSEEAGECFEITVEKN
ncbi:MAG: hypothetical protein CVV42_16400 [Candidatus Riflebacteria bacterium HGW-Riflebacteria-2]|jgi:class 3 adenylate cyclase|nr:MAG: hypothetical protein CVV42_16400 [Candidatus Riflebacteria bacterium HGW-Riflebacteria-2]